jgi:hypothetical protein
MPYPPPNSLQRFLTISNARIIYSHEGAVRRNQDVLATDGVMNVFPNQSPDKNPANRSSVAAPAPQE